MKVIMAVRLHALYQRSTKMLVFFFVVILAVNITCGVISVIISSRMSGGRLSSGWSTTGSHD